MPIAMTKTIARPKSTGWDLIMRQPVPVVEDTHRYTKNEERLRGACLCLQVHLVGSTTESSKAPYIVGITLDRASKEMLEKS
jgi:hypothetical protein